MTALVWLLEHLVCDHNVDKGLLDGKVGCIIKAINRHVSYCLIFTLTDGFILSSVCKQQDAPMDIVPVGTSHDLVSQPDIVPVGTLHDLVSQPDIIPVGTLHDLV